MRQPGNGRLLVGLIAAASGVAAALAFFALYRLRDDPIPDLGAAYQLAAFLQPIPFLAAAGLAVFLRRRATILKWVLAGVVGCGAYGAWWLLGLEEVRRVENQPVRRNALGNIFPDIEGQAGAAEAMLWPLVVAAVIGGCLFIGWYSSRPARPRSPVE